MRAFKGLTHEQVKASRTQHGSNALPVPESEGLFEKLWGNFQDPMIIILVVALLVIVGLAAFGYASWYEGIGIAAAVVLATFVATFSEHRNEQTFQKLQEEASQIQVNVFRQGRLESVPTDDVVVGDLVMLHPGDRVVADGRLIYGDLGVNQSVFTGEAAGVSKQTDSDGEDSRNLDAPHMLFRGTTVEEGEAVMEVHLVGEKTYFGQLAKELKVEDREGPLRTKLGRLADGIAKFGYIGGSLIALAYMFKSAIIDNGFDSTRIVSYLSAWQDLVHDGVTAVILAVIIVVVAVPEGLPMMIAIVLAQNMRKLLHSKVLVRQLLGIETAGSMNLLFCDKTGTITKGVLEVDNFVVLSDAEDGPFVKHASYSRISKEQRALLDLALRRAGSCVFSPSDETGGLVARGGNASERVLATYVHEGSAGLGEPDEEGAEVLRRILFSPMHKFSASRVLRANGSEITLVKGAPEFVLDNCSGYFDTTGQVRPLFDGLRQQVAAFLATESERGLRIIAVAAGDRDIVSGEMPGDMHLVGLVSIRDELRVESPAAIAALEGAGIHVVMLTGDKMGTARAIAREAGMTFDGETDCMESSQLDGLTDEQLAGHLDRLRIVARCRPEDKKRLVKVAQNAGLVVGMTGDGVNDAPALRNADVGFGLGSGTEVAKESSHIIVLDDNVSSIANAVLYGRAIYRSIQKFIVFQLTVNVAAIAVAFVGPFLGFELPLTMTQLLWINLIMDTLAALAFSGEPPLPSHMRETPKDREEHIITPGMWSSILSNGLLIAAASVVFLLSPWVRGIFHSDAAFLTGFFGFFVFANNWNKFNARVDGLDLLEHIGQNKAFLKVVGLIFVVQIALTYFGGEMFRTVALQPLELLFILVASFIVIPFDLARKAFLGRGGANPRSTASEAAGA